jgi:hypothetical protein
MDPQLIALIVALVRTAIEEGMHFYEEHTEEEVKARIAQEEARSNLLMDELRKG